MTRDNSRAPRRDRGFTLIELIIALAITSMIALSLFGSLYIAFRARDAANREIAPIATAEMAMEMIRADLESAEPPHGILVKQFLGTYGGSSSGSPTGFQNGAPDDQGNDSLVFYGAADGPKHVINNVESPQGEIKQVVLLVEKPNGSNDHALVRQITGNLLSQNQVQPDEEIICRHVVTFRLRYFDGSQWQTAWDSTQYQNTLPSAIEVTLELRPPDAAPNAPLIHLRRIFPVACISPPDTGNGAPSGGGGGAPASGNAAPAGGAK